MANMEELRAVALAYYENASDEVRQRATEFFISMDTNGDGGVSFNEFVQFFLRIGYGYNRDDPNFFRRLDRNGDGFLDFREVLTFYYIFVTRVVRCASCGIYLMGRYFTCVACFHNPRSTGPTHDLCSRCYGDFRHQHQYPHYFLDSYVLLRDKKACLPLLAGAPNPNVWCGSCQNYLGGLYFTCVACFDNARSNSYDLCSTCYGARRHQRQHPHHNYFLDNFVLLRAKAGLPLQQALVPPHAPNTPQQSWTTFQKLQLAIGGLSLATTLGSSIMGCSIM